MRTDLDAFSTSEQKILENHGYMMAEMAIAELGAKLVYAHAPPEWPHPDYADEHIARASIPEQTLRIRFRTRCKQWLPHRR
jgi:NTE family protein